MDLHFYSLRGLSNDLTSVLQLSPAFTPLLSWYDHFSFTWITATVLCCKFLCSLTGLNKSHSKIPMWCDIWITKDMRGSHQRWSRRALCCDFKPHVRFSKETIGAIYVLLACFKVTAQILALTAVWRLYFECTCEHGSCGRLRCFLTSGWASAEVERVNSFVCSFPHKKNYIKKKETKLFPFCNESTFWTDQ